MWRCAPEQLRRASNQEVTIAELFNVNLKKMQPKVWTNGERERERGRGKVQDYRDPGQLVKEQARRWKELVSANEDRCREGLPPVMELPPYPSSDEDRSQVEHFALDGAHDL